MKRTGAVLGLAVATLQAPAAIELPASLPPHPRLLLNRQELPAIKQRLASQPWAKARFAALQRQADAHLKEPVKLPEKGGQWYHYYSCPKHGARLRTESPVRHVCPVDGEVLTGYPYDDVVLMGVHGRLAGAVRTLGLVHQLTSESRYAAKAREILLAYADQYDRYPLHTIRNEPKVGGGKVGPQTLDESVWLITMVEGADCIWDTLSPSDRNRITAGLLRPAVAVIRQHKMGIHNIQCWKNSAVGLTGLLLGDLPLVDEAVNGESGYSRQMAKGVSADGPWYEGAWGYHFYTLSAVLHLTEGAHHSGINLYSPELKRMFDAPLDMAMPNLELPAFNDSHTVSLPPQTGRYETALARFQDNRYRQVISRSGRETDEALLHGVVTPGDPPPFSFVSRNFPAAGNAILAAGNGPDATWLCLDYGPHGGGHGHPDKLGFVLHALRQTLAPDPGTANYGVPIQAGWYRTTLAHNTLTIDQTSQKPADGRCLAFLSTNGFSAVMADAGKLGEGVTFTRSVFLMGESLLVFIDQIQADRERTFDLAFHHVGALVQPPGEPIASLSDKPGYSNLRGLRNHTTSDNLHLSFQPRAGLTTHWAMAGGAPTTYVTGTGVGGHTEDRVPVVIARRKTVGTAYLWSLNLAQPSIPVNLEAVPVALQDGRTAATAQAAAVAVKSGNLSCVLAASPAGGRASVRNQSFAGNLACFTADHDGKLSLLHVVR